MSQAGFDVIRFDYAGTGDSDGGIERLSFRQWTNDIRAVIDASRQLANVERVSVLGVRLGANLLAEAELSQIEHFVAWDPVLNGASYLDGIKEMHAEETAGLNRYLKVRDLGRENCLVIHGPSHSNPTQPRYRGLPNERSMPCTSAGSSPIPSVQECRKSNRRRTGM